MTKDDNLIDAALRAWAQAESSEEHPSHSALADYAVGDLSPEQSEEVGSHLSLCGDCAAIVAELLDTTTSDPAAEWKALRAKLQAAGELPAQLHGTEDPSSSGEISSDSSNSAPVIPIARRLTAKPDSTRRRWLTAAAAAVLGLALGLSLGLFGPSPTPSERPTSDTQVHTVASAVRGIPPRQETIEVSASAGKLLILLPTFANRAKRYRVEAKDSTGALLWDPWEAQPDALGNVPFELRPAIHGLGKYRIELYPLESADPSELVFEIELTPQAAEP